MEPRQINIVVTEAGRCPLLAVGDSFSICANEVSNASGKICHRALHALYPQLGVCLEAASPNEVSSYGPLVCAHGYCETNFRAEVLPPGQSRKPEEAAEARHRNARRAAIAAAMLQNLGSFMERVPPDISSRLMRASVVKSYVNGEVILPEGVKNERFFIVGDGEVCLTRRFPLSSEDSLLAVLGVGECFGEMALLTEELNQITVRAHPAATIYSIQGDRIRQLMTHAPLFNLAISQMLADRLRVFLATIEDDVRPGMRGDVATIPVVDLVQALNAGRRTGTLVLDDGVKEGRIVFDQGKISGATLGKKGGEEVFYQLAALTRGHFSFETSAGAVSPEERISKDTLFLLMEYTRRADEAGHGRKALVPGLPASRSGLQKAVISGVHDAPDRGIRKSGKHKK